VTYHKSAQVLGMWNLMEQQFYIPSLVELDALGRVADLPGRRALYILLALAGGCAAC